MTFSKNKLIIATPFVLPMLAVTIGILLMKGGGLEKLLVLVFLNCIGLFLCWGVFSPKYFFVAMTDLAHITIVIVTIPLACLMLIYSIDTGKDPAITIALCIYAILCYISHRVKKEEGFTVNDAEDLVISNHSVKTVKKIAELVAKELGDYEFFRRTYEVTFFGGVLIFFGTLMILAFGFFALWIAIFLLRDSIFLMMIILLFGSAMVAWGLYTPFDLYAHYHYYLIFFEKGVLEKTWKGMEYFLYDEIQKVSYQKMAVPGGAPGTNVNLWITGSKHQIYYKSHLSPLDVDYQLDRKVVEITPQSGEA